MKLNTLLRMLTAAIFLAVPTGAFARNCDSAIDAQLSKVGVDQADVEKISVLRHLPGDNQLLSYKAWVTLKGKPGALIIELHAVGCVPSQNYTVEGLELPNVKSY